MLTKITIPTVGDLEFDDSLAPVEWADDSHSSYMNVEPPYRGEAPGDKNYYSTEINGKKVTIFNQAFPAAACMYVNEILIDMDCVYDCENIRWVYGGMPYGCWESHYDSIYEMPSFCKEILELFISLGKVYRVDGTPSGKFYAIPDYKVCTQFCGNPNRRSDNYQYGIEVEEICERWLTNKINEILSDYLSNTILFCQWHCDEWSDGLLRLVEEKSQWAKGVLLNCLNSFLNKPEVTAYITVVKTNVINEKFFFMPLPEKCVFSSTIMSTSGKINSLFDNSDNVPCDMLSDLCEGHSWDNEISFGVEEMDLSPYLNSRYDLSWRWDSEHKELTAYDGKSNDAIVCFSDFSFVKLPYKRPFSFFDVFE